MTISLNELLISIIYISLIVLVIILIILGIRLIKTLRKVDDVINDVNVKIDKFNGIFDIIDKTADFASLVSDKVINGISTFINALFKKKKGNDEDE